MERKRKTASLIAKKRGGRWVERFQRQTRAISESQAGNHAEQKGVVSERPWKFSTPVGFVGGQKDKR